MKISTYFGRDPLPIISLRKRALGEPEIEKREPDQWAERMVKVLATRDWIKNLDDAFIRQSEHYNLSLVFDYCNLVFFLFCLFVCCWGARPRLLSRGITLVISRRPASVLCMERAFVLS